MRIPIHMRMCMFKLIRVCMYVKAKDIASKCKHTKTVLQYNKRYLTQWN